MDDTAGQEQGEGTPGRSLQRAIGKALANTAGVLEEISEVPDRETILIIGHMDTPMTIAASRVLRRIGKVEHIDVVIDSPGGDLDAAMKLSKILRNHCGELTVSVPFSAKSAATLLAIGADQMRLSPHADLGPVDPQVQDPETGAYIPAHSIGRALEFISAAHDKVVKISLAEKLSPLLIGAYKGVEAATKQEVEEVCARLEEAGDAVEALTSTYMSHAYPLMADDVEELNLPAEMLSLEEAEPLMELHDAYVPLTHMHSHDQAGNCIAPDAVVQTKDFHSVIANGGFVHERLDRSEPSREEPDRPSEDLTQALDTDGH